MITFKEYQFLRKVEKNNVSSGLLKYSLVPDFMLRMHETEVFDKISRMQKYSKPNDLEDAECVNNDREDYIEQEKPNYKLISRLIDRSLLEAYEKTLSYSTKNRKSVVRYFRLTDKGYDAILHYKNKYKFWIPIFISIASLVIAILAYLD